MEFSPRKKQLYVMMMDYLVDDTIHLIYEYTQEELLIVMEAHEEEGSLKIKGFNPSDSTWRNLFNIQMSTSLIGCTKSITQIDNSNFLLLSTSNPWAVPDFFLCDLTDGKGRKVEPQSKLSKFCQIHDIALLSDGCIVGLVQLRGEPAIIGRYHLKPLKVEITQADHQWDMIQSDYDGFQMICNYAAKTMFYLDHMYVFAWDKVRKFSIRGSRAYFISCTPFSHPGYEFLPTFIFNKNLLYITGGGLMYKILSFSQCHVYDMDTGKYKEQIPNLIHPRFAGHGVAIENKIFVIGGKEYPSRTQIQNIECYDPTQRQWTVVAQLPSPEHVSFSVCSALDC